MTEEQAKNQEQAEIEIQLPEIIPGPITLEDGSLLQVGDRVAHAKSGKGTVMRIALYQTVGLCVYVQFDDGSDHILGVSFVQKIGD